MGRHFLMLSCLCIIAWKGSHASVTPEDYWKMKLPTTLMPQSIKDALVTPSSGEGITTSLVSTSGYDGLLSYKGKASTKNSLTNTKGYDGLLSYAKDSTQNSLASAKEYDGLLSYAKGSTKDLLANGKGYDGLLSYAKHSTKESLASANGYDGLLSYAKDYTKDSLASANGYDGLLSYAKDSTKDSLANGNGYEGLLSYSEGTTKDSLSNHNGYDGLLSYAKDSTKDTLASNNGYDGLLSYAKISAKDSLTSAKEYTGLLSYAKISTKDSLIRTSGYDGLLSYAKEFGKDSLKTSTSGYDGLLSYAKSSRKMLAGRIGYDGLLSYAKGSHKCDSKDHTPSTATNIMENHAFFVEEDLHKGKKMNLIFEKGNKKSIFLPREVANTIPFSSKKLSKIYKIFSLDPKSTEANVVSKWTNLCEEPTVIGVEKKCVTSLESMIDFVTSKIGNNVKALTTNVIKSYPKMEYTIKKVKMISKNDHETVVCHKMAYPYALFFCHGTATIRSYIVTLVGSDNTKIEAVAACHKETNDFLSNYMINVLKVIPGSTRVCHFPGAEDNIIWVAN